jgi:hypothetical protein
MLYKIMNYLYFFDDKPHRFSFRLSPHVRLLAPVKINGHLANGKSNEKSRLNPIGLVCVCFLLGALVFYARPSLAADPKPANKKPAVTSANAAASESPAKVDEASSSLGSRVVKVHGVAFSPEYPERLRTNGNSNIKNAWGARYVGPIGSANWFHASVPITAESGASIVLSRVSLLFNTKGATLVEVHLWDGANKIGEFKNLALTGDHTEAVTATNTFRLPPGINIKNSLGVSLGVSFDKKDGRGNMPEFIVSSLSAVYQVR